jgi:acetolactate synthase small subunit
LGVPVRVHYAGVPRSLTLELSNVSFEGSYFHTSGPKPRRGQWVAFGFVTGDRLVCAARGRVVRVDDSGFALQLEGTNSAFESFVADISGPFTLAA